jgi:hypothetical protein
MTDHENPLVKPAVCRPQLLRIKRSFATLVEKKNFAQMWHMDNLL